MKQTANFLMLSVIAAVACVACARTAPVITELSSDDEDVRSGSDSIIDINDTNSSTIADSNSETDINSDEESNVESDSEFDADSGSGTNLYNDSESGLDSNSDTYAVNDTDTDSDSDTYSNSDSNSDTDSNPDSDRDTGSDPSAHCTVYVNAAGGHDDNDGLSWNMAKATIPAALDAVQMLGCEDVWVARGVYGTQVEDSQAVPFSVPERLNFIGGFSGTEDSIDDRNIMENETVLNGLREDGSKVKIILTAAFDAVIDGFVIESAEIGIHSDFAVSVFNTRFSGLGVAVQLDTSIATIDNCDFMENDVGVLAQGEELRIQSSSFVANKQGIEAHNGTLIVTSSDFDSNFKTGKGGAAIFIEGTALSAYWSNFSNNRSSTREYTDACMGGAILAIESDVNLDQCQFKNNFADDSGGAVALKSKSATITLCDFRENQSPENSGGAVYLDGLESVEVYKSSFVKNFSAHGGGAMHLSGVTGIKAVETGFNENISGNTGGAVHLDNDSSLELKQCNLHNNIGARAGGAISLDGGSVILVDDTLLKGNRVQEALGNDSRGGAIFTAVGTESQIVKSTFLNNFAPNDGGGIYNSGTMVIENSLLNGNGSLGHGGAISSDGIINVQSCTVTGNVAQTGTAALDSGMHSYVQTASVGNSIFWANSVRDFGTTALSNDSLNFSNLAIQLDSGNNISADPYFVHAPLETVIIVADSQTDSVNISYSTVPVSVGDIVEIGDDGVSRTVTGVSSANEVSFTPPLDLKPEAGTRFDIWGTGVYTLAAAYSLNGDSPCIDAGSNLFMDADYDIEGNTRIVGAAIDMGAYELQ